MASINARPPAGKLICEGCGCTDDNACPGGCHWVSFKPPVCSACASTAGDLASLGVNDSDSGPFGAEHCPASDVPAPHIDIWLTDTSGYCARCKTGFAA